MRVGNFDPGGVKREFDLFLDAVFQLEIVLLQDPGRELDLQCGIAETPEDKKRLRLFQAEMILLGDVYQDVPYTADVFFVGNTDIDIQPANGELGEGRNLRLDQEGMALLYK